MQLWYKRAEVWGELMYVFDDLGRRDFDIIPRLNKAADKDSPPFEEFMNRFIQTGTLGDGYYKAKRRADARNAHEAIEKGLKALLLDAGMSMGGVRRRGHELYRLLVDVQRHSQDSYKELERSFDYALQRVELATGSRPNVTMIDYFRENGTKDVFLARRYGSLEDDTGVGGGEIFSVNREIIRALSFLVIGKTPRYPAL